jgi:hypothetical protein
MTPVFSGGLVYEYSMERVPGGPTAFARHEFGIVEIKGNTVTELDDFGKVKKSFEKPLPSDDGGYKPSGKPSACPPASQNWEPIPPPAVKQGVKYSSIPSMPRDAENYMKNGAGIGPGFKGSGSHDDTREGGAKSQGWDPVVESGGTTSATSSAGTIGNTGTAGTASTNSTQSKDESNKKNAGHALASSSIGTLLFGAGLLAAMQSLY